MSSKYDSIKTAADLVTEVAAHGFSTEQEDQNRAADIFGNTSIEELDRLANDIGRNNQNGEPDPKGTWSSSRKGTQETFYFIAFSIWNWQDATRFFNQHTNPDTEQFNASKKMASELAAENKELRKQLEQEHKTRLDETSARLQSQKQVESLKADLHDAKMNEMELKAKLYDLITVEKEA